MEVDGGNHAQAQKSQRRLRLLPLLPSATQGSKNLFMERFREELRP